MKIVARHIGHGSSLGLNMASFATFAVSRNKHVIVSPAGFVGYTRLYVCSVYCTFVRAERKISLWSKQKHL